MKKTVSVVLALVCLVCGAFAAMAEVNVVKSNPVGVTFKATEDEEMLKLLAEEVEKLAAAKPIESYFDEVRDSDGVIVDLNAAIQANPVTVNGLNAIVVEGYDAAMGDVEMDIAMDGNYPKDEKVLVLVGMIGEDDIDWISFDALGTAEGNVNVTIDAKTLAAMQDEGCVLFTSINTAKATPVALPAKTNDSKSVKDMPAAISINPPALIIAICEDAQAVADAEIAKLAVCDPVETYFDDVDVKAILGAEKVNVNELWAIYVKNYNEPMGEVTAVMQFPTPYANGEKLAAMIGLIQSIEGDNIGAMKWVALDAIGTADGNVQIAFDVDTLLALQDANYQILAIAGR